MESVQKPRAATRRSNPGGHDTGGEFERLHVERPPHLALRIPLPDEPGLQPQNVRTRHPRQHVERAARSRSMKAATMDLLELLCRFAYPSFLQPDDARGSQQIAQPCALGIALRKQREAQRLGDAGVRATDACEPQQRLFTRLELREDSDDIEVTRATESDSTGAGFPRVPHAGATDPQ